MNIRENWRIGLLVVFVVLASIALFVPRGGGADAGARGDPTNLQYGLDLSGGIQVQATLVGQTAEDLSIDRNSTSDLTQSISSSLDLETFEIQVTPSRGSQSGTVEVFGNVSTAAFEQALADAGLDVSRNQLRDGVTSDTRERAAAVIDDKIQGGGLAGGSARLINTPTGASFISVETPSLDLDQLMEIITSRGRVQVVASYPVQTDNGTVQRETSLLTQGDFERIGQANQGGEGVQPNVDVTLERDAAVNFSDAMQKWGFTGEGEGRCSYRVDPDDPGWCLLTVLDGNVTYSASMGDLADSINAGTFVDNPSFILQTTNFSEARELLFDLETGALPTRLDVESQSLIQPSLAQEFKLFALITGIIAWLAVSGAVFFRYRQARVAIPMLLTAGAEVYILLGFAATVGLALDLSHIAGFIAVIGTGVDDLVIIADEILQEGKVATGRVFQNRFRKAFWVIGAAAATTIMAMSPLMVLSLGTLSGFAIVTIVGVLIGVLVTRPAYGDVLRNLLLSESE